MCYVFDLVWGFILDVFPGVELMGHMEVLFFKFEELPLSSLCVCACVVAQSCTTL